MNILEYKNRPVFKNNNDKIAHVVSNATEYNANTNRQKTNVTIVMYTN
jgi:hypothetical protein